MQPVPPHVDSTLRTSAWLKPTELRKMRPFDDHKRRSCDEALLLYPPKLLRIDLLLVQRDSPHLCNLCPRNRPRLAWMFSDFQTQSSAFLGSYPFREDQSVTERPIPANCKMIEVRSTGEWSIGPERFPRAYKP